jgi:hypothetical protein
MRNIPVVTARLGLFTLAAMAAFVTTDARAQTKLRWKFEKGQTLTYEASQKSATKLTANNQTRAQTNTQLVNTTWRVKNVTGDVAEIGFTFDRFRTTIEEPNIGGSQNKIEYDSKDNKVPEGQAAALASSKSLVGAEITFKINGLGEVTDVKLPEQILEAIRSVPAGGTPQQQPFTEDGIKKMIVQSITLPLPEEPVSKGQSWHPKKNEVANPAGLVVILDDTYTYRGPETYKGRQLERIDLSRKSDIKLKEGSPIQLKVNSDEAKGTHYFDNVKGHLFESTLTQKQDLTITAQNQEMRQANDITVGMKLISEGN